MTTPPGDVALCWNREPHRQCLLPASATQTGLRTELYALHDTPNTPPPEYNTKASSPDMVPSAKRPALHTRQPQGMALVKLSVYISVQRQPIQQPEHIIYICTCIYTVYDDDTTAQACCLQAQRKHRRTISVQHAASALASTAAQGTPCHPASISACSQGDNPPIERPRHGVILASLLPGDSPLLASPPLPLPCMQPQGQQHTRHLTVPLVYTGQGWHRCLAQHAPCCLHYHKHQACCQGTLPPGLPGSQGSVVLAGLVDGGGGVPGGGGAPARGAGAL
jgi:hypothetical protein